MQYAFILGQNPALSILEIVIQLKKIYPETKIQKRIDKVLIVDLPSIKQDFLIDLLGGTVKIVEIINQWKAEDFLRNIRDQIFFVNEILKERGRGKINFGLSVYGKNILTKNDLRNFLVVIKNQLKNSGVSSRFLLPEGFELSSVQVKKNKAFEFDLIIDENEVYAGKTLTVSNFENWNRRDYGRPAPHPQAGMLPLKLARMLINIANPELGSYILDPFCGSGTIVNELAYLGYKNIFAADKDKTAIEKSKRNFDWLKRTFPDKVKSEAIFKMVEAKDLEKEFGQNFFDVIITEGFLGPALKQMPSEEFVLQTFENLKKLYKEIFPIFKKILKPEGTLVFIAPIFAGTQKDHYFPDLDLVFKKNFKLKKNIAEIVRQYTKESIRPRLAFRPRLVSPRDTLIYGRENQKVKREIIFLEPV